KYARSAGKDGRVGKYSELRRAAALEEVVGAMLFLAGNEAIYITGQAFSVDFGISASLSLPGRKI
ncbi:MAG: SDR family oxidoreductase, partial [Desulfomonilia bacterium]